MVYVLFGANDFALRSRLQEIRSRLGDEESLALNTTPLEAKQLGMSDLVAACNTVPFLGTHRMVVVEGLLGRFDAKEGTKRADLGEWNTLNDYVVKMPSSTLLVLIDGELERSNPLLRKLAPVSKVEEFRPIKGIELQQWVHSQVAENGGKISSAAVKLLTDFAGENLWVLSTEIEKLCLFTWGRRIEEEDVRIVTSHAREANVFAMLDAVVEKRLPAAMRFLHQLLAEGMAPNHVLYMLTRQLRLMVEARELNSVSLSLAEKQKRLGVSPRFPIDRLFKQTARYSPARLTQVYGKLLETDVGIKTGRWKENLALDLLVTEVCS